MKLKKSSSSKLLASVLIALSTLSAGNALAHSNEHHSKPAKAEQLPWGIAGDAKKISRTIEIGMGDDFRFLPGSVDIKQNETIRFVIKNNGKMLHEMVIGTPAENAKHAELMLKFPNMKHDEPYMAHVKAGSTGEIIWTFNKDGQFEFACLIGGHYQAGMKGTILVQPASKQ
ncbi:MAG: cupredoxin family protein [Limnobacter sp.]|nr:cupredoxin family protein [Limnobacter sp.]